MGAGEETIERLLARVTLGSEEQRAEAREALRDERLALEAVERSWALKVAPRFHERLALGKFDLPARARERLHEIMRASLIASTLAARKAADIFASLGARGIDAVSFKGIGLMGNLYGSPSRRMAGDVDLLVAEPDLLPALAALSEQGYRPLLDIEGLLEMMRQEAYPTHRYLVVAGGGIEVDVHWQINNAPPAPLRVTSLIARSETVPLAGGTIRAVAPADAIVLTVHHTVRESFQPDPAIKDLGDLDAWCIERPDRWRAADVAALAAEADLLSSVAACARIVAARNPSPRAVELAAEADRRSTAAERGDAGRLVEFFERQLDGAPVNADLLKLLSGVSIARFVAQRTRHREQNRRIRQLARARGPERPHGWARFAELISALVRLSPARLRAYRTMSLQQRAMRKARSDPGTERN